VPIESILILFGVAAFAVSAMAVALGAAWLAGRRRADVLSGASEAAGIGSARPDVAAAGGGTTDGPWGLDTAMVDRVVRVVALLFIAAVGAAVALSGAESAEVEAAIYVLLAGSTLFIVFMQDLLPSGLAGRTRFWLEAAGAVVLLTILVGLTGGLESPFFVGYFLLVGGASLVGEGLGPIALALGAAVAYAVVGVIVALAVDGVDALDAKVLAWVGFNVVALLLLAYVGTVAGRAQRRARDAALRLSRYDALTGLYNRGAFFAAAEREIKRVERTGRGFCVLMLDLDDLKPVNDTYGHPAGDQLLRAITEVVLRTVRATDLAGRYGGDEFVVLLPETDAEGAFVVAETLRRDISALALRVPDRSVRTSVSLGLVAFPDDGRTIEELLSAVDAAMYEAKRRGKNQIVGYTTRTERVATSIGPERAVAQRPPRVRPDESRSAEIGLARRPSMREETDEPIEVPPYADQDAAPVPGTNSTAGPTAMHEDLLDAAAPAFRGTLVDEARMSALSVAAEVGSVPSSRSAPGQGVQPSAGAATRSPIRVPSMPSLLAQPLRTQAEAAAPPVRLRAPIRPRDAVASGLPPVPPAGAPWPSRSAPGTGSIASRDPRKPAYRQYVALPIEDDDPDR